VLAIMDGKTDIMVGWENSRVTYVPLAETWEKKKPLDEELIKIYRILSA